MKKLCLFLALVLLINILPVNLAMAEALAITQQPKNVVVASGETAKVSVTATGDGLSYRWYYAEKGATTFSASSVTTASYSLTMNSTRSGRRVYCVVSDSSGNKVTSNTVTLTMGTALKITKQPANVTVASGATAKVSVTATGDGLSYRWYYADKGVSTFSASSVTTASYALTMNAARDGRRMYCVVTDKYGRKVTSSTVTLSMAPSLTITKQPANVTVASGKTATVSVTASGDGLSYRWYYADKGVSTFSASSVTTASYALTMNEARDGRRVYCVVSDSAGNKVTSNTVTLSMAPSLTITKQPVNVTVASGKTATVSVTASGDGLSYRWYYADKGVTTFSASSVTNASYALTMTAARDGRRVYCVVSDSAGNKVTSNTVTLSMAPSLTITKQPANVTVASGKTATVSVTATGDGLSYRWYYAEKGATTFSASSVTTASYALTMTAARDGRRVYCVITDQYGNKATSNTVTLSMAPSLTITKQPVNVTVASGKTATVSVTASGDGLSYRWYYADKGVSTFSASSVTTASYALTMTAARDGRRVYCVVTDKYGNKATSTTVTLSLRVPAELKITQQPTDVTVASGKQATVSVTATGDGLTYRWYYKDITGAAFAPTSVTTSTYSVWMNDARDGRQVYCVITDQYGNRVTSDTVTLATPWPIRITLQPVDVAVHDGTTAEIKIIAAGDGLTYRWYYADKNADTFSATSITADTYTLTMSSARDGRRVYCLVSDRYGQQVKSSIATLTMLEKNVIPEGLEYTCYDDYVTITGYTGNAKTLSIPKEIDGYPVKQIGYAAFRDCTNLTNIVIPSGVISIGNSAFSGCSSLTSITIPNGVTSIGDSAFASCSSLVNVAIPNSVTSIENWAFSSCSSLTSITIPNKVTSIGSYAFAYCDSLASVALPNSINTISNQSFLGCISLTSIIIPSSVTSIDYGAFIDCRSLTNITIPSSVISIGDYAFSCCYSLTDITIPSSVTFLGNGAFWSCHGLTSITIPSSITSIGDETFWECSLTHVTIPSSVTSIGSKVFRGCSSLTTITIPSSVTSIGNYIFAACDRLSTIKVKSKSYAHQWCVENGYEDQVQFY